MKRFIQFQLPAVLWAGIIFVSSSIPSETWPPLGIFTHDKLIHATIYFVFCALTYRAVINQTRFPTIAGNPFLGSLLIVAFFGAGDEIHQLFVSGRNCDFFDWVADSIGGVLFVLLAWWMRSRRQEPGHANG